MSSTEEGGGAVGAVSTDQTIINNNTNNDSVSIDMPCTNVQLSNCELKKFEPLFKAFQGGQPNLTPNPLIRKVPSTLRGNEDFKKYFKPKVISVGPLHHDGLTLPESKELKRKLAAHFVRNIGVDEDLSYTLYRKIKKEIDDLKKCYDPQELKKYIDDLKKCYDPQELEKYSGYDEKLAWMFFVDGCAILQAVYMRYGNDDDDEKLNIYSQLFIKNDLLTFVYSDLLLLENQIPFRVLELLTKSSDGDQFVNAIIRFINRTVKDPQSYQQDSK